MSHPACDPQTIPRRTTFWVRNGAWLAAAAGALCFTSSLTGGFVYDDLVIVCDNPRIRSLADPQIWTRDWWQPVTPDQQVQQRHRDRLYRPLTLWTIAANYAVGELQPFGYHLVNLALHVAVCVLVWRLAQRLFQDQALATIAALIFAVHPVHAEAVAGIVGRAEILAALFMLLGLLALAPTAGAPGWKRIALAGAAFTAALFSKETAICYWPVALVLLHATRRRWPAGRPRAWWLAVAAVLAIPLLVYLPARYFALDGHLLREFSPGGLENPLALGTLPQRWLHAFTVAGHYVRLMLVPSHLSCNYGYAVLDPKRGPEILTFLGMLAAGAVIWGLRGYSKQSTARRQIAVLCAIFLASYVLISNTIILIGVAVAERLMYWPSVPIAMALAAGVVYVRRRCADWRSLSPELRRLLPYFGIALLAALAARTLVRNADWSSNLELFQRDVATYPQSAMLQMAAAKEMLLVLEHDPHPDLRTATLKRIDDHLQKALEIYPRYGEAMQLKGRERALAGDRSGAISYFEMATRLAPLDRESQAVLARLRDESGAAAAAVARLGGQVTTRPADPDLRLEYGQALLNAGRYREALPQLQEAVRLRPADGAALASLGEAYAVMNEPQRAIETLQTAAEKAPDNWQVHVNLAGLLAGKDPAAALHHAEQAEHLAPDRLEARLALAEALAINNRTAEALTLYRRTYQAMTEDNPLRPSVEARIHDLERAGS
jgi:tetratricopeptide (TPR) repeat protein